jgi:hypothetical protein
MRSDFINKRELQKRRITQTQNFVDGEVIVIPEFDTMFLHEPPAVATQTIERWRDSQIPSGLNLNTTNAFNSLSEMAIGLLNPWDDGHDRPDNSGSPFAQQTRPRTPTRIAMAFNLSALPTNVQITDAKLNLTVSNKRDWD